MKQGDYRDNHRRFAFFSLAALTRAATYRSRRRSSCTRTTGTRRWRRSTCAPTLGRATAFYDGRRRADGAQRGLPGPLSAGDDGRIGLPWELYNLQQLEWYGRVNLLKGGMAFADAVAR